MLSLGFVQKLTKASILSNVMTRKLKSNPFFNYLFLEKSKSSCLSFSKYVDHNGESKMMNCISRTDEKDKNLFLQENDRKRRWNLFSQIAIKNDLLTCAREEYSLTDICNFNHTYISPPLCTLLNINEVVEIDYDPYT